ncbi:MAG TPA: tetratricopeptide repeat protein [Anaerolineales bacterium]|nr:tetratricopeptide repeat protein [Anaerolineales bacterium]
MSTDFQTLPPEYQAVLRLAQDTYRIDVTPLQLLVGGWSGAIVYLVSVSSKATNLVEHCILKLDRKGKSARSDEVTRHNSVRGKSPPKFARNHIAELVFDRVEHEGAIAIFYRIAGQSLLKYRPLSGYERQSQLQAIFIKTNHVLLQEWNADAIFLQAVHPQKILETWLGFRLDAGGNIERFLQDICQVNPDVPGFLINGHVFPNPLLHARKPEAWGKVRSMDVATGFLHGDLNTNNILVKFYENKATLEGYYLIDFALFKEGMPLLYDQRYLEMSYLMQAMLQVPFAKSVNFLTLLAVADIPDPHKVPIETSGVSAVIASARSAFAAWVDANHPSLHDDLWGQYWLAGVAAGLAYCHKAGQPNEARLAGLIFAAANLKRFTAFFPVPSPGDVQQLYDEHQSGTPSEARSMARPRTEILHNLPNQPTTFIGREEELAAAREMLLRKDVQMVTFTGPGGTGKTRLSLEVAHGLIGHFKDGVFFVPLGDITDPNHVIPHISQQLEVRAAGSQPLLQNLKDYLNDKNILLLLDNFEQLIPAAPVVAELLAAAPSLKILVTSRILLNLRGEHELPVLPLDTPVFTDSASIEQLAQNESVKLFLERAQTAQARFTLNENNASAIAQICQRLDGLPLAIELAAARVKMLPPHAILTRLTDRLKLLTGGAQDLPARQQTLRNTLDWSYSLLNAQEKTLYARLAVFVGGFMFEDAEAICNLENDLNFLDGITSLVNNSLLKQEESTGGEPRFRMLETIHEYALERLSKSGEMQVVQERHAQYFIGIVLTKARIGMTSRDSTAWLDRLEREHANIQAALEWNLTTPAGRQLVLSVLATLTWFWYRRGFFNEGRLWTDRLLTASAEEPAPVRAAALQMSSRMAMWRGDLKNAVARATESLTLWQRLEDEQTVPMSLMETGVALINIGKDSEAHALLKEAEVLFRESGASYFHAITLVHLGNVSLGLDNPEEAREWLNRAYPLFKEIGEEWGLSFVLNNLGEVARVQGNYELAFGYYKESEALLRATGDKGDLARLVHTLGYIAAHKGDVHSAEAQFRESLAMFRRLGNKRGIAECIAGLASLRVMQGNLSMAATMLGAAEALLGASGAAWWPADRVEIERTRARLQSGLNEEEFHAAWKAGQSMTLDQAITFVSNES